MLEKYSLVGKCRPIRIAAHDSSSGARIGGNAPSGVVPAHRTPETRYFATLPLDDGFEMSIFLDFGPDYSLWHNRGGLRGSEDSTVQCVRHLSVPRDQSSSIKSDLTSHALIIEGEIPESQNLEDAWFGHKFGGYPHFHWRRDPSLDDLASEEFIHLLQFNFPDYEDGPIKGNWPFCEAIFHIFAKENASIFTYKYIWG